MMAGGAEKPPFVPITVGRYVIGTPIASGGMASVHLGRLTAQEHAFARTVAIKRLHPHLALDPAFVAMFLDEARLASRIRHANVVPVLDIVSLENELFLVMEYIDGIGLNVLLRVARKNVKPVPNAVAVRVALDLLEGLHAAHEAKGDDGTQLDIVHRDVSPQNVLVGSDGIGRVVDFGVAKAIGQLHETRSSEVKGKIAYMAPEQLFGLRVTRSVDIYAAAIILWEALAGRRLFQAASEGELVQKVTNAAIDPPSTHSPSVTPELDAVVMKGLARDPAARYATAAEMAEALEHACTPAARRVVAQWVKDSDDGLLAARAAVVASFERGGSTPNLPVLQKATPSDPIAIPVDVMPTTISSSSGTPSIPSAMSVGGVATDPAPMTPPLRRGKTTAIFAVLGALAVIGGTLVAVALRARAKADAPVVAAPAPSPSAEPPPAETAPTPTTPAASPSPVASIASVAPASSVAPAKPVTKPVVIPPKGTKAGPKSSSGVPLYGRD